jgi:hypothetical protein
MIYWGVLYYYTPKTVSDIYEYELVETKKWLYLFIILIIVISVFICKLMRPTNEMKYLYVWIFSIAILSGILYFLTPSYIVEVYFIHSNTELLWSLGCLVFISSLSILIYKGVK